MDITPHFIGDLGYLIIIILLYIKLWCCLKGVFRRQGHANPIPVHPLASKEFLVDEYLKGLGKLALMVVWDEHIVLLLDHT